MAGHGDEGILAASDFLSQGAQWAWVSLCAVQKEFIQKPECPSLKQTTLNTSGERGVLNEQGPEALANGRRLNRQILTGSLSSINRTDSQIFQKCKHHKNVNTCWTGVGD